MIRGRAVGGVCFRVFLGICTVILIIFLLAPLVITALASFGESQYLDVPPKSLSLRWYEQFAGDRRWIDSIVVSLKVAILSTIFVAIIGTAAAVGLSRTQLRSRRLLQGFMISPLIIPLIVVATAEFLLFQKIGMLDSILAMAIGHTVVGLPVMIMVVLATLSRFDIRLEDAAVSLGASRVTAVARVTIPCISAGVIAGSLFTFLSSLDELMIPLFISGPNTQTLSVRIWDSVLLQVEPTVAAVSTTLIVVALSLGTTAMLLRRSRA